MGDCWTCGLCRRVGVLGTRVGRVWVLVTYARATCAARASGLSRLSLQFGYVPLWRPHVQRLPGLIGAGGGFYAQEGSDLNACLTGQANQVNAAWAGGGRFTLTDCNRATYVSGMSSDVLGASYTYDGQPWVAQVWT